MKRHYLKYIAYLQIIGILLVVFGHSFHEYPDSNHGHNLLIYKMMYTFRMPLFLFVSGFLMVYTTRLKGAMDWKAFVKGKFKRLLIPYFVLSLIVLAPRCLLSSFADEPMSLETTSLWDILTDSKSLVIPYYWFLLTSFTLLLVNYTGLYIGHKLKIPELSVYLASLILFAVLPLLNFQYPTTFSLNKTATMGIYFILGMCYARYGDGLDKYIKWDSPAVFLICLAIWAGLYFTVAFTVFRPLCSIAGIAMSLSLARIMVRYKITFLDHLLGTNYIIFLLSWFGNVASQQMLHHIVELPWPIYTILSMITGIYVPWSIYRYMQSHPGGILNLIGRKLLGQSFKTHRSPALTPRQA